MLNLLFIGRQTQLESNFLSLHFLNLSFCIVKDFIFKGELMLVYSGNGSKKILEFSIKGRVGGSGGGQCQI